jgi:hypothetical protein
MVSVGLGLFGDTKALRNNNNNNKMFLQAKKETFVQEKIMCPKPMRLGSFS